MCATRVIVFTGARGYRHESTEAGALAVVQLAAIAGVEAEQTDDPAVFDDRTLAGVAAVVWMQTSGSGNLDGPQRGAYERFTAREGGFAGVHAAADGERDWPLFSRLVGARFAGHPPGTRAATVLRHGSHPSIDTLPDRWHWTDEWYGFDRPPAGHRVLLALDLASIEMGELGMPDPHPLAWAGTVGAARVWYTALGHDAQAFEDPAFRSHLWGGIASVVGPTAEHVPAADAPADVPADAPQN
ncbi:MAG: hypothetical protein RI885_1894 [Actinomycetota bacterium]|jgi:type 1 glutamine amidotransferase